MSAVQAEVGVEEGSVAGAVPLMPFSTMGHEDQGKDDPVGEGHAPRVAFSTLGCKVNGSETESFISAFLARGYRVVPFEAEADVYVVNTCTVTTMADRKSRQEIRQAGRRNPLALVAATGCYVSVANRDLGNLLPGNLLVVHNREKDRLVEQVDRELALRRSCTASSMQAPSPRTLQMGRGGAPASLLPVAIGAAGQRTRATLKVQDGCNAGCTFCIIPRARGGPRSVALDEAVRAARVLEGNGYREIVLTGVLLGSYGRDLAGQPTLGTLVERLLAETSDLRFRISSVEAQDFRPEWLSLWGDRRLCRHLHLPLQSGSDEILQAMRRQYDTRYYVELVETARREVSELAVTTDILVGFPGEDDARFALTEALARRLDFAGMHVFRYSARPGTLAARMPDQVADAAKRQRSEVLRGLDTEGRVRFHATYRGTVQQVLWEQQHDGIWHGTTDNHLEVYTRQAGRLRNQLAAYRLEEPYADGLWATPAISPCRDGVP